MKQVYDLLKTHYTCKILLVHCTKYSLKVESTLQQKQNKFISIFIWRKLGPQTLILFLLVIMPKDNYNAITFSDVLNIRKELIF